MNSRFLSLPLRELHEYVKRLELDNEKLRQDLAVVYRFNCILENVKRSHQKGYSALKCIDKSRSDCQCQDRVNQKLRRAEREADIELSVWMEQYDKMMGQKGDGTDELVNVINGDDSTLSLNSRESVANESEPDVGPDNDDVMSDPENDKSKSDCETCAGSYGDCSASSPKEFAETSAQSPVDSAFSSASSSSSLIIQRANRTPPLPIATGEPSMVVKSTFECDGNNNNNNSCNAIAYGRPEHHQLQQQRPEPQQLKCDWPNCFKWFSHEENLIRHRRNHIRKSLYHCEYCGLRFLDKEELQSHMKRHANSDGNISEFLPEEDSNNSNHSDNEPMVEADDDRAINLVNSERPDVVKTPEKENCNEEQRANPFELIKRPPVIQDRIESSDGMMIRPEEYKRTRYSGIGRYRCPWPDCGYTPHFLRDLRRHMHKHTGDKKHKCGVAGCDFVSVWKTSLLQHQRKKHFMGVPSQRQAHIEVVK